MKSLIHLKQSRKLPGLLIPLLTLTCFTLSPRMQAVSPPPDGGYPGGNTAEGQAALLALTSGTYNTGVGLFSLRSNTEGNFNTAIGAGTLLVNTGSRNTATGAGALLSNTTAEGNTANGTFALFSNTIGENNTANGAFSLFSSTEASGNTADGNHALFSNTTGTQNSAIGLQALLNNTTGGDNTAIGALALFNNTTEGFNTATGSSALFNNTTGAFNTANGYQALFINGTGIGNTAIGDQALFNNTTGIVNTALGIQAGTGVTTANNVICIGSNGQNVSNSCFIGNIRGVTTAQPDAIPVVIDSLGQLGTQSSSRRFKADIKPMEKASEAILALKPVTFRYKNYKNSPLQFGLIAEEVAEINQDLVARDENGEIYTVRYDQVNAMLLNEFLKEHRKNEQQESKIEKQEAKIARQEKQIEALTTGFQKVSAQLEMSRTAPQIAVNNQ